MASASTPQKDVFELRAIIGLTQGLPISELESLTVDAIHLHRALVSKAEDLFEALPDDYKTGRTAGGDQHRTYITAAIEMHAQMVVVNTLIDVLGYIPKSVTN